MLGKFRPKLGEEGATTVEFVLWVPIFTLMMITILDASVLMLTQSKMYDTARSHMRLYALGAAGKTDAENAAIAQFLKHEDAQEVEASIESNHFENDPSKPLYATLTITVPTSEVLIFTNRFFGGYDLEAQYSMVIETATPVPGS